MDPDSIDSIASYCTSRARFIRVCLPRLLVSIPAQHALRVRQLGQLRCGKPFLWLRAKPPQQMHRWRKVTLGLTLIVGDIRRQIDPCDRAISMDIASDLRT